MTSDRQLSTTALTRLVLVLLAAFALALAVLPAGARAAGPLVGIQDERLLHGGGQAADTAVADWRRLGVGIVRLHARWSVIAPSPRSRRAPSGFNPSNHRDRRYDWSGLDHALALVDAAGLQVMLTVTGPGPLWTSGRPSRRDPRYNPSPRAFARFARAVATRYRDRVDQYLIWNEPNQPGWLRPQSERRGGRWELAAPHIYRDLLAAAAPQIRRADRSAEIVIGELAPLGWSTRSEGSPLPPLPFLRAMACVDERYRRVSSGPCRRFRAPAGDSIGYHPHPKRFAPDDRNPNRDEATIGDLPRLFGVVDRLTRMRRLDAPGRQFPFDFTEFGYQTSPPDHSLGIPLDRHARYLQHAAYISWAARRVRSFVHYQWQDEPVFWRANNGYAGWQSGLQLINGDAKPALRAFPQPFVVDVIGRGRGRLWGQVRGGGRTTVTVMRRNRGQGSFTAVQNVDTDEQGYWSAVVPLTAGADYGFAVRSSTPAGAGGASATPTSPTSGIARVGSTSRRGVIAANAPAA